MYKNVKMKARKIMKTVKKVVRKMSKYVLAYGAGSIFGRTVYASKKSKDSSLRTSILGAKVYKEKKVESNGLWDQLKKLQK